MLAGTAKQAVSKAVSKVTPSQATQKVKQAPQKAKQIPQKAKQVPQKARQVGKQVGRAAQQAAPAGFKGALRDQDTLANLGAGALVGLAVLIAASVTSGSKSSYACHPLLFCVLQCCSRPVCNALTTCCKIFRGCACSLNITMSAGD